MTRGRQRDRRHDAVHASSTGCSTAGGASGGDDAPAKTRRPSGDSTPAARWLPPLTPSEWLALFALEVGTLAVYASTLYPSVAGGDSGELVAESCHLGVSHPPGYPLFNMLVHGWMELTALGYPGNTTSPAWSANFFSAGLVYMTVIGVQALINGDSSQVEPTTGPRDAARWPAAFTAAALFAFSPLTWTYAVSAEVFALNNLFAALLLLLLLVYELRRRDLHSAVLGAFVSGLAMCNQHTIVLFEAPIILWVLWTFRSARWTVCDFAALTSAFVAGLVPYAYMPLTAAWNPQPGSWGDVATLAGLFHHIRRADYGTFRLFASNDETEGLWTRLYLYATDLSSREIPLQLAFPVIALGIWSSIRPRSEHSSRTTSGGRAGSAFGGLLVALFAFYLLVFHSLSNLPLDERLLYGVHMRFWQQPNVIAFVWLGLGLQYVQEVVAGMGSKTLLKLAQASCVALVALQIATWYELMDQSRAVYIRDYARALLDPLPHDAVLFVSFDLHWTALRYLQRCEQYRPDVTVLQLSMMTYQWFATKHRNYPQLTFPGPRLVPFGSPSEGFTMAELLDANMDHQSQSTPQQAHKLRFFLGGHLTYNDHDFEAKYWFVPFGLVDEFHLLSEPPPSLQDWYSSQQQAMQAVHDALPTLPPPHQYDDETWEWTISRNYGMKMLSRATYLLQKTIEEDPQNVTLLAEATHAMEASYQFEPQQFWNRASNLKNLGLAYAQIVKSNVEFDATDGDVFFNDEVGKTVGDWRRLNDRASARMLEVWHEWLQVPDARNDPGYAAIESVVRKFVPDLKKPKKKTKKTTQRKKKKKHD